MLDPQAAALLELIQASGLPPVSELAPAQARQSYRERRAYSQPEPSEVALVREHAAPGPSGPVPLREYRPLGAPPAKALPALVYFHGGGWVIGDRDTHDVLCRALCNGSGCAVFSVDYRLAPEHPFPAAIDDALAATRWVAANAVDLKLDAARIAVGGDSAGGNIAAVVSLALRGDATTRLAFQLLIYPATDQNFGTVSYLENGVGYLLTAASMLYFRSHYLPDAAQWQDWRASPLLAVDLSGLPPALILTAGFDPLRDEGLAYADKLADAGNRVEYICFSRQIHGFITMGRVIGEAQAAVDLCAGALRRGVGAVAG
jgi:acetyl esterase